MNTTSKTESSRVSSRPARAIPMSEATAPIIQRAARATDCGGRETGIADGSGAGRAGRAAAAAAAEG